MKNGVVSTSRTELATEVYDREAIQSAKWKASAMPARARFRQSRQVLVRNSTRWARHYKRCEQAGRPGDAIGGNDKRGRCCKADENSPARDRRDSEGKEKAETHRSRTVHCGSSSCQDAQGSTTHHTERRCRRPQFFAIGVQARVNAHRSAWRASRCSFSA